MTAFHVPEGVLAMVATMLRTALEIWNCTEDVPNDAWQAQKYKRCPIDIPVDIDLSYVFSDVYI